MKKIMIIDGGPRKTFNTASMLQKFAEGAMSVSDQVEVKTVRLYGLDYKGCMSCMACKIKGKASNVCKYKDALTPILEEIAQADGLVLGSPIYFGDVTGQMRTFLERLAFPWLSYNDYSITAPKHMPVVLVETLNGMPETNNSNGYGSMEYCIKKAFGEPQRLIAYNTYQVKNYDRFELAGFSEEAKRIWREEHWEQDLQKAFEAGRKMAEKILARMQYGCDKSKIYMKNYIIFALTILLIVLAGCKSSHIAELQRFERSILKEFPFSVDSVSWLTTGDLPTFRFANAEYIAASPDAEIRPDGDYWVCNMFDVEQISHQTEENIWRNVLVSRKNRRVVCIDRYLRDGRTVGYGYVFQSERKEYPTYGTFHWDVSDSRNIEMVGVMLDDLKGLALRRHLTNNAKLASPVSQDDYWHLIFHADSLFDSHLYDEARQVYDLAFSDDRFILPSQLSTTAKKMATIGDKQSALAYLRHRIAMEKDFYEVPSTTFHVELKDTFEVRSHQWNYDLALKERLENIFERDQYDRLLWSQAVKNNPGDTERNDWLARQALMTDSLNLVLVDEILSQYGFPRKEQVGDFGNQAAWLVFQHADLDYQKRFLPQLETAVSHGDIAPLYLAMLRDRIDVREGRSQRYGTQMDDKGNLAPLLDASRVNQWRQEVGLPPIEQFEERNN